MPSSPNVEQDPDSIVSLQDVEEAQQAIANNIVDTPFLFSRRLSELCGATIYLKFENRQYTGAFKERGALNKLLSLSEEQRKIGVIAVSAGNHAQGVAYHAQRLGIPAVIVMPCHTPHVKVHRTASFGAEVLLHGEDFDEAKNFAINVMSERGLVFVHPYDDPLVIAGQGTIGLEMLTAQPDLDAVVVPVGGGGMLAGIATVMHALRPQVDVVGAQTERFPSMARALSGAPPDPAPRPGGAISTIADGIAVRQPGALTLRVAQQLGCEVLLVDEGEIEDAMLTLLEVEKTLVEGAGAVGLATVLRYRKRFAGRKVGLILCGSNINPLCLADVIRRGMVRSGRLTRLQVEMGDIPGCLSRATRILADANANIQELHHSRAFTHLPVQSTIVDFELETKGNDHVLSIIEELRKGGFDARPFNDEWPAAATPADQGPAPQSES